MSHDPGSKQGSGLLPPIFGPQAPPLSAPSYITASPTLMATSSSSEPAPLAASTAFSATAAPSMTAAADRDVSKSLLHAVLPPPRTAAGLLAVSRGFPRRAHARTRALLAATGDESSISAPITTSSAHGDGNGDGNGDGDGGNATPQVFLGVHSLIDPHASSARPYPSSVSTAGNANNGYSINRSARPRIPALVDPYLLAPLRPSEHYAPAIPADEDVLLAFPTTYGLAAAAAPAPGAPTGAQIALERARQRRRVERRWELAAAGLTEPLPVANFASVRSTASGIDTLGNHHSSTAALGGGLGETDAEIARRRADAAAEKQRRESQAAWVASLSARSGINSNNNNNYRSITRGETENVKRDEIGVAARLALSVLAPALLAERRRPSLGPQTAYTLPSSGSADARVRSNPLALTGNGDDKIDDDDSSGVAAASAFSDPIRDAQILAAARQLGLLRELALLASKTTAKNTLTTDNYESPQSVSLGLGDPALAAAAKAALEAGHARAPPAAPRMTSAVINNISINDSDDNDDFDYAADDDLDDDDDDDDCNSDGNDSSALEMTGRDMRASLD